MWGKPTDSHKHGESELADPHEHEDHPQIPNYKPTTHVEQHAVENKVDAFVAAIDCACQSTGLAVQMEVQVERVQMLKSLE